MVGGLFEASFFLCYHISMSIDFDISHNLHALEEYFDDIKTKAVLSGSRSAINKTLVNTRKWLVKMLAREYKLRPSGLSRAKLRGKRMRMSKASGARLEQLVGEIKFSVSPESLLQFVTGSKEKIRQKGIKISKRRKLKAEIRPGRKIVLKKAFIQQVRSKAVFRRGKKDGFYLQAAPSIGLVVQRPTFRDAMLLHVGRTFNRIFSHEVQYRLDKIADKTRRAVIKKV